MTPEAPHAIAQGGSIANLIGSIGRRFGDDQGTLPPLSQSSVIASLAQARTVVLLLFDGLGYAQLQAHLTHGALANATCDMLTSVFPSSTAPAVCTLASGLAPSEHAVTGWLLWSQRHGSVVRPLPSDRRGEVDSLVAPAELHGWSALSQRVRVPCLVLQPSPIADSPFSRFAWAGASRLGYRSLSELQREVVAHATLMQQQRGGFVYAYLPHFDSVAHEHGWLSQAAGDTARALDQLFSSLRAALDRQGILLLATADHGFVDIASSKQLRLEQFPALGRCLATPLWGEPRVAFCRVHPWLIEEFRVVCRRDLSGAVDAYDSDTLARAGWFGPPPNGQHLSSRIGDFTLISREGYTLVDRLPGERMHAFIGMHGGTSAEEMQVPLAMAHG